jgi:hypothetical protein
MATAETQTAREAATGKRTWLSGATAGLVGGAVFGAILSMMMTPVITTAIPALYGTQGGVAGWIAHLIHSALFGMLFAGVATIPALRPYTDRVSRSTVLGLGYGIVLWLIAAGIVMPYWLQMVGFAAVPPLPNLDPLSLVGHLIYGAVLGVSYPYVSRQLQ